MNEKTNVCLVSRSVLKEELEKLVEQGSLKAELVFVSKYFHVDYELLEKNLRKVLEQTLKCFQGKVVLVYGDLCLGQNNEMKKLAEEHGIVKVDAVNCIDCQLGGKGKFLEADPEHNLMFMGPGMIGFFKRMKEKMRDEGVDEAAFANLFSGIKGIVLLDTCGNADKCKDELEKSGIGLRVLETRKIGLENVKQVLLEAIEKATSS
ncbi:MAG: DUF1638 domain-containing protein [Candidatus Bathyarchaeota archaeon]|nr:DUF1638 domain-containing protein [Candidatus Bathyarchaeota archaeon]